MAGELFHNPPTSLSPVRVTSDGLVPLATGPLYSPTADVGADIQTDAECHERKWVTYSIIWSASNWSELGTVRPRAAAVLRLMTSSYLTGS